MRCGCALTGSRSRGGRGLAGIALEQPVGGQKGAQMNGRPDQRHVSSGWCVLARWARVCRDLPPSAAPRNRYVGRCSRTRTRSRDGRGHCAGRLAVQPTIATVGSAAMICAGCGKENRPEGGFVQNAERRWHSAAPHVAPRANRRIASASLWRARADQGWRGGVGLRLGLRLTSLSARWLVSVRR